MLRLDLKAIGGDAAHVTRTWNAEALPAPAPEDYRFAGEVQLDADVRKSGAEYRLSGTLSADLDVPCSRCLEPYRFHVKAPFDLRYVPRDRNRGEGELEIAKDDLGVAFYDEGAIDLGQLVREQGYLALPMKPLCRETCRGLCPVCGTNLNVAACECRTDWIDPRLEPLRRLRGG